jgi:hypothetical protein
MKANVPNAHPIIPHTSTFLIIPNCLIINSTQCLILKHHSHTPTPNSNMSGIRWHSKHWQAPQYTNNQTYPTNFRKNFWRKNSSPCRCPRRNKECPRLEPKLSLYCIRMPTYSYIHENTQVPALHIQTRANVSTADLQRPNASVVPQHRKQVRHSNNHDKQTAIPNNCSKWARQQRTR